MAGTLVAEQTFQVGSKTTVEGGSPSTHFAVVFEDDGATGYLYGLDLSKEDNPILDALHIYNVQAVTDRALPSTIGIIWSVDGLKAALLVNNYPHAVFDFAGKRGYCRTGFPPSDRSWTQHSHAWSDDAIELFR